LPSRTAVPALSTSSTLLRFPADSHHSTFARLTRCRGRPSKGSPLSSLLSSSSSDESFGSSEASSAAHPLAPYGWDADWEAEFSPHAAQGLLLGRVVRVDRGQCDVVTADGVLRADTAFVTPDDPLRVVCTGDWAVVEPAGDPRYVRTYLPRRSAFVRSTSSKRSEGQILAANVDHAIVAVSLAVELDLGRVERFLALAWESGMTHTAVDHQPAPGRSRAFNSWPRLSS